MTSPAAERTANVPSASGDDEGLVAVDVRGVDHVYARPGADLGRYTKVMLDPVEVSFSKSWDRTGPGGSLSVEEKRKIRDGLARIVREELAKELQSSGRYTLVDTADEDVLRIKADIRDLYVNAPDVARPGIIRRYTLSAGEMRLVAELRDAATGALIARVVDFTRDPESAWFELTTQVSNVAAARRAATEWARILHRQLDAARGVG